MFKKSTVLSLSVVLLLSLTLVACGGGEQGTGSIGEQLDYEIIGIDPGAGIMQLTINEVLPNYGLDQWKVVEGSGAAMTAALTKAYNDEEPIIVTGWTPHWKFAKFDLKYLEDPDGIYGGAEDVNTIVRLGLKEDHPNAYTFLDQFNWTPEDLQGVMVLIQDGIDPQKAAEQWVNENQDKVNEWTEGAEAVDGDELKMVYVAWSDVIASTNIVSYILEENLGYNVELIQVDAAPMWAGVASGDADAMVGAWLPTTHESYYKEFEGEFEDLGPNLSGTKIGLIVPSYMDINSIEDLKE
jgi:glycine betaine/proline transport system substrate-binding protein